MPLPTVEQVQDELAPLLTTLDRCLRRGWERWGELEQLAPDQLIAAKPRSRSSLVYDFAVDELQRAVAGTPGVELRRVRGLMVLVVDGGRYAVRLKKLDRRYRPSVNSTDQQRLIDEQLPLVLEGLELWGTHLIAGYQLDELGRDIASTALTCNYRRRLVWALDLGLGDNQSLPSPMPFPAPSDEPRPARVRVKESAIGSLKEARGAHGTSSA